MAKEDLPLAIKATNNTAEDGMGGVDCPMDCDPKICDNSPTESTQCFKVDRSSGKKQHLCKPFEKVETLRCPQDFVRCAMAAPAKGKIYTVSLFKNAIFTLITVPHMHNTLHFDLLLRPYSAGSF